MSKGTPKPGVAFIGRQKIAPGVRAAIEMRHPSWQCKACFEILRQHHAALVCSDWPGCPTDATATADFAFIRRHGPDALYASGYTVAALRRDAARIRRWLQKGRDVHVCFNNDACGFAIRDALRLKEYLAPSARA
jgi:uncharacterized protein YecE (DUF72 family)